MKNKLDSPLLVKAVTIVVVLLFLLVPILNDVFDILPEVAPHGMPGAQEASAFSKRAFLKRKWQRSLEERAKKESGLWTPLMKVENELLRTFFSQISAFTNQSVLVGHDNYLFQPAHLSSFNRRREFVEEKVRERFTRFKELQDRFRKDGKALVLLITPTLIHLYPDVVPLRYTEPGYENRESGYEKTISILRELDIVFVDSFALLRENRAKYPFRFFARSGAHWNDVGSCLALRAINDKLEELKMSRFRKFSCDKWHYEEMPRAKDRDLVKVANVLFPERFYDPTPYVDIEYLEPEPAKGPHVQFVGTSFLFSLLDHVHSWKLADSSVFYFYNKMWKQGGVRGVFEFKKGQKDWGKILDRDIFIINIGVNAPSGAGYGFVEQALAQLNRRSDNVALASASSARAAR